MVRVLRDIAKHRKYCYPSSNTVKDLGLTISSNLSWSSHIQLQVKCAYSIFYNPKRSMPPNTHWHTKITLFKSYIFSTVLYPSEIWCPSKTDLTRLELLQSRVLKWAFPGTNYKESLPKAKMLPISLEIRLRSLILLNRILNGLYSNFPILSHISFTIPNSGAYNTRLSEKPMFHLPKVKKTRTTTISLTECENLWTTSMQTRIWTYSITPLVSNILLRPSSTNYFC